MLPTVREDLTRRCVKLLASYRRNCALGSPPGQLILPESFKLLPLYTLAMLKSKALKGGNIISDVRVAYMRHQRNLGVAATIQFLYPRMVALHVLRDEDGIPVGDYGRIPTPPLMRCSYSWMEPHGAYLLGELSSIVCSPPRSTSELTSHPVTFSQRRSRHHLAWLGRLPSDPGRSLGR